MLRLSRRIGRRPAEARASAGRATVRRRSGTTRKTVRFGWQRRTLGAELGEVLRSGARLPAPVAFPSLRAVRAQPHDCPSPLPDARPLPARRAVHPRRPLPGLLQGGQPAALTQTGRRRPQDRPVEAARRPGEGGRRPPLPSVRTARGADVQRLARRSPARRPKAHQPRRRDLGRRGRHLQELPWRAPRARGGTHPGGRGGREARLAFACPDAPRREKNPVSLESHMPPRGGRRLLRVTPQPVAAATTGGTTMGERFQSPRESKKVGEWWAR